MKTHPLLIVAILLCHSLFGQSSIVDVVTNTGSARGVVVARESELNDGWLGTVVTANHVVNTATDIRIVYSTGRKAKQCRVLAQDENQDVALIAVWMPKETELATMAEVSVSAGESLRIHRWRGCLETVAAPPTDSDRLYADAVVMAGDSGGPVYNSNGHLVGVISGGWFWYDGRKTWPTRACNVGPIRKLLKKQKNNG